MGEVLDNIEADELGISAEDQRQRRVALDKRSGSDMKNKWSQADREKLAEQQAKIAPAIIIQPRCHVCIHPHRLWIEQMVVKMYSYKRISEALPEIEGVRKPSRRSISDHVKLHMPLEQQTIRATHDEEARLLQQNIEEGARGAATDRGMLKVLIRKAYELAEAGSIAIETRDMISMIKLLNDMDVKSATSKADEYERDLGIFIQAIRNVCDEEIQRVIVSEVRRLRSYDDIEAEVEEILEGPKELPESEEETFDAEIIEIQTPQ